MRLFYRGIGIVFFSLSLLNSCSSYKSVLKNETEKIIINIHGWENDSFIVNFEVIEITDKDEIDKIIDYVSTINSPLYKCGYEGTIEYYCKNNNVIIAMEFNTNCNTIVFEYDDKIYNKRISKNGLENLKTLVKWEYNLGKEIKNEKVIFSIIQFNFG